MPSIADPSAINDQDDDDDSSEWGRVIAWVMDAVKVYVQENADTSVKAVKVSLLALQISACMYTKLELCACSADN